MSKLKKKLSKLKSEQEMEYLDELADGPIMTKRYWKAIQKARKEKREREAKE